MKKSSSYRRHRNPPAQDEKQQEKPFFSKNDNEKSSTFFNAVDSPVQAKLTVGQPGDVYEKEADSVADSVVNKSSNTPEVQQKEISSIQRSTLMSPAEDEKIGTAEGRMEKDKMIQEMPEKEPEETVQAMEEEEPVQAKEEEEAIQSKEEEDAIQEKEEEEPIQAKANNTAKPTPGLGSKLKNAKGGGKSLSAKTQHEMESSIGADFSGVNIHTDAESVEMNRDLNAQAFTNGKDVFFNSGKYRPETTEGKRLLAHELTHVVQQGDDAIRKKETKPSAVQPKSPKNQKVAKFPGSDIEFPLWRDSWNAGAITDPTLTGLIQRLDTLIAANQALFLTDSNDVSLIITGYDPARVTAVGNLFTNSGTASSLMDSTNVDIRDSYKGSRIGLGYKIIGKLPRRACGQLGRIKRGFANFVKN